MRVSDLTTEPLQELPEAQPIEEEEEEVLEEEEVPEYLHASELGVCVDENGLPNFLDMVIEIPSSDLPMVIEIPAGGQTEEDCDSDDEDDLKPSRVWDVVSTADAESAAVSMDRDSHGVGTATVDDDDDEEEDSFAEAGEKEEIHNKVRNLASMLRKKSAVHVSKSERRVR